MASGPTVSLNPPTKTTGSDNLSSPTTSCGASTPPASNGRTTSSPTRARDGTHTRMALRSPHPRPSRPSRLRATGPLGRNPSGRLSQEAKATEHRGGAMVRRRSSGQESPLLLLVEEAVGTLVPSARPVTIPLAVVLESHPIRLSRSVGSARGAILRGMRSWHYITPDQPLVANHRTNIQYSSIPALMKPGLRNLIGWERRIDDGTKML